MSSDIGRTALPLVGALAGSILGGPIGASIGLAIGTGAAYFLFPAEGKVSEGPRLDDLTVTFSSYGKPIPLIYGTMEVGGNVVWSPGLKEHRVEEDVGGKGGPSMTSVTWLYTASFRINYSVGVADAILKNWADGKLIRDRTGTGPVINYFETEGPGLQAVRDFFGTTTQLPGPAEQADKGVDNVSAYRGTVGQEWEDMPLENYGNRIPQLTAEIAMDATESFPRTTLTGIDSLGVEWEWQQVGQTFLTNRMSRIDNVSQTVLVSDSRHDRPDFPCVFANGNYFRTFRTHGLIESGTTLQTITTGVTYKDPTTGAAIGANLDWDLGRVFGGITGPDGIVVGELIFLQKRVSTLIIIVDPDGLEEDLGGVVNTYDSAVTYDRAVTVDNDKNLWAFYNSGGDTKIDRIEPGVGAIEQTFTITGDTHILVSYEPNTNSLIFASSTHMLRWDIDTSSIVARVDNIIVSGKNKSHFWNGPSPDGMMYIQEGETVTTIREYDIINMVATGKSWSPHNDFGTNSSNTHWGMYDPLHHAFIKRQDIGGTIDWLYLDRMAGDDITVRSVVEDVSSRVDYVAGTDIDATELTDTFPGYIVRSRMTARKALEPLAAAFNFRSVESDFKIKFPKRGGASVGNIPQIDLGATAGETPTTQALKKTRIPEDQLFETAIIEYVDETFDNNFNTQQAKRSSEAIDVGGSLKFDFPGRLGNDQAAQIIERMLFQAWAGRTNIDITVPMLHVLKDAGDVVTVTKDGKTYQVELHNVKLGANSIIKMNGTIDDSAVHISTATGAEALGVETQTIVVTGQTEFFILDTSLLRDVDNGDGVYVVAGTPASASWPGAAIQRGLAIDTLTGFTAIVPSRDMDYGFTQNALTDASPDIFDRDNTIIVDLFSGTLTSDTETNVLNGTNALLVGNEIVQFVTAVLNSDGTYTLSTLLRGRRGTDFATGTHVAGDRVVVLSANTVLRVAVDLSDHLTTFVYRAITLGSAQFSSATVTQQLLLRSQMPYAPSHLAGTIAADAWTFTLVNRTRIGGSWKDSIDAPLGEGSENYEWDVMDGATVKRTLTSIVPTVGYSSADQNTDFGDDQTTIELNVYQLSDDVGRGFVTNVTLVGG